MHSADGYTAQQLAHGRLNPSLCATQHSATVCDSFPDRLPTVQAATGNSRLLLPHIINVHSSGVVSYQTWTQPYSQRDLRVQSTVQLCAGSDGPAGTEPFSCSCQAGCGPSTQQQAFSTALEPSLRATQHCASVCRFTQTSWYRALFPFLSGWLWAKYPAAGIQNCVQQLMGTDLKLSNLHTSVLVPSYELQSSSPFTFWHHHKEAPEDSLTGYVAMRRAADTPQQVCY